MQKTRNNSVRDGTNCTPVSLNMLQIDSVTEERPNLQISLQDETPKIFCNYFSYTTDYIFVGL